MKSTSPSYLYYSRPPNVRFPILLKKCTCSTSLTNRLKVMTQKVYYVRWKWSHRSLYTPSDLCLSYLHDHTYIKPTIIGKCEFSVLNTDNIKKNITQEFFNTESFILFIFKFIFLSISLLSLSFKWENLVFFVLKKVWGSWQIVQITHFSFLPRKIINSP